MTSTLVCWKCGASLATLQRPLSRLAECPKCRAYLHVCRMCEFYDPRLTGKCREERAEEVRDKEHANFCDWFQARPDAHRPPAADKTQAARSQLDTLFGGDADKTRNVGIGGDDARADLRRLFDSDDKPRE